MNIQIVAESDLFYIFPDSKISACDTNVFTESNEPGFLNGKCRKRDHLPESKVAFGFDINRTFVPFHTVRRLGSRTVAAHTIFVVVNVIKVIVPGMIPAVGIGNVFNKSQIFTGNIDPAGTGGNTDIILETGIASVNIQSTVSANDHLTQHHRISKIECQTAVVEEINR